MTMKQLLPYLFATLVVMPACGSKSDASSSSKGGSSEDADPVTTAPRTGKIDPNAMRRPHQNAPEGSDGSAATGPAPSLPADDSAMKNRLDTDGDGKISPEERLAGRKARAESMRTKLDTNGDGRLTPDELAKSENARMIHRLGDPAKLDTNGDGDISADELSLGMAKGRNHGGVRRGGDDDDAGSAAGDHTK
jgi:hypothetical protein